MYWNGNNVYKVKSREVEKCRYMKLYYEQFWVLKFEFVFLSSTLFLVVICFTIKVIDSLSSKLVCLPQNSRIHELYQL